MTTPRAIRDIEQEFEDHEGTHPFKAPGDPALGFVDDYTDEVTFVWTPDFPVSFAEWSRAFRAQNPKWSGRRRAESAKALLLSLRRE